MNNLIKEFSSCSAQSFATASRMETFDPGRRAEFDWTDVSDFFSTVTEDNRNVSRWNSNDLFNKIGCQLERLPSMLKFRWISDDLTHDPFKERNGNAELTNTHQILKTMLDNKAFLIFRKWINDLLEPHTRETDLDTIHLETKIHHNSFLAQSVWTRKKTEEHLETKYEMPHNSINYFRLTKIDCTTQNQTDNTMDWWKPWRIPERITMLEKQKSLLTDEKPWRINNISMSPNTNKKLYPTKRK